MVCHAPKRLEAKEKMLLGQDKDTHTMFSCNGALVLHCCLYPLNFSLFQHLSEPSYQRFKSVTI